MLNLFGSISLTVLSHERLLDHPPLVLVEVSELLHLFFEDESVLVVDDREDDAGFEDEVEERDGHVEGGIDESVFRIADCEVWSVVRGDHEQQRDEDRADVRKAVVVVLLAVSRVRPEVSSDSATESPDVDDDGEEEERQEVEQKDAPHLLDDA